MGMLVRIVAEKRQRLVAASSEQRVIFRVRRHRFRMALTANGLIEADHPIRRPHHDVKIVAHHDDPASERVPNFFHLAVEIRRARLVQPLGGLVEHEELRLVKNRAGHQYPLKLTTGQRRHGGVAIFRQAGSPEGFGDVLPGVPARQVQKTVDRQRQGGINVQALRDVANL